LIFVSKHFSSFYKRNTQPPPIPARTTMPIFRRRESFPNAPRRVTIFVHDAIDEAGETYQLFRQPGQQLTSGMTIAVVTLYTERQPILARLHQIVAAYPGLVDFRVQDDSQLQFLLRVPADWVRLTLWERIRFGHRIHTPETFSVPSDVHSEESVPVSPPSHAISRLRPSISMFELSVQPPQED
jgi:hypothetical protein